MPRPVDSIADPQPVPGAPEHGPYPKRKLILNVSTTLRVHMIACAVS